jgi:hypothetical protein
MIEKIVVFETVSDRRFEMDSNLERIYFYIMHLGNYL